MLYMKYDRPGRDDILFNASGKQKRQKIGKSYSLLGTWKEQTKTISAEQAVREANKQSKIN